MFMWTLSESSELRAARDSELFTSVQFSSYRALNHGHRHKAAAQKHRVSLLKFRFTPNEETWQRTRLFMEPVLIWVPPWVIKCDYKSFPFYYCVFNGQKVSWVQQNFSISIEVGSDFWVITWCLSYEREVIPGREKKRKRGKEEERQRTKEKIK